MPCHCASRIENSIVSVVSNMCVSPRASQPISSLGGRKISASYYTVVTIEGFLFSFSHTPVRFGLFCSIFSLSNFFIDIFFKIADWCFGLKELSTKSFPRFVCVPGEGAEATERGSAGHVGQTSPVQLGH